MPTVSLPTVESVAEDAGSVTVCATLSGVPGTTQRDFTVTLATADGTGNVEFPLINNNFISYCSNYWS